MTAQTERDQTVPLTEQQQAKRIADAWLDGRMNSLTQMVPGDPDCDACVLARQYVRLLEQVSSDDDSEWVWRKSRLRPDR